MYGLMMGGIAGVATVSPTTWGLLLFAFEMYLLFRAVFLGPARVLWLLIPTFVLWANLDQSFLTGLVVLAAAAIGCLLDGKTQYWPRPPQPEKSAQQAAEPAGEHASESSTPRPASAFIILAICALGCLVNPFTYQVYADASSSLFPAFPAGDEDHDVRLAFVLRPVDPRTFRARLVSCSRRSTSSSCSGPGLVLLEHRDDFPGLDSCRSR